MRHALTTHPPVLLTNHHTDVPRPRLSQIQGKVVVGDMLGATCWFNVIYDRLSSNGVVALVDLGER